MIRQGAPFIPIAQQRSKGNSAGPSFKVPDLNGNNQLGDILDDNYSTGVPSMSVDTHSQEKRDTAEFSLQTVSGGQDCLDAQNIVLQNSFDMLSNEQGRDFGEALHKDMDILEVSDMLDAIPDNPKAIQDEGASSVPLTTLESPASVQDRPPVIHTEVSNKDQTTVQSLMAMPITTYHTSLTSDKKPMCTLLESSSNTCSEAAQKSVSILKKFWGDVDDESDDGHEVGEDIEYPMLYCSAGTTYIPATKNQNNKQKKGKHKVHPTVPPSQRVRTRSKKGDC